jgi:hypothetical protein
MLCTGMWRNKGGGWKEEQEERGGEKGKEREKEKDKDIGHVRGGGRKGAKRGRRRKGGEIGEEEGGGGKEEERRRKRSGTRTCRSHRHRQSQSNQWRCHLRLLTRRRRSGICEGGAARVGGWKSCLPQKGETIHMVGSSPFAQAFAAQEVESSTGRG